MNRWRSSTLSALDNCRRALRFALDGEPRDRRVFMTGTAAHVMLQAVGEALKALVRNGLTVSDSGWDEFCRRETSLAAATLMSDGRSFDGGAPEVLPPGPVRVGTAIAADYLSVVRLSGHADYEIGLAVDSDMRDLPYDDPAARLVGILDMVALHDRRDEDGGGGTVLLGVDYKTSWRAGPDWLEGIQATCQRVLLWARATAMPQDDRPDGIAVAVVNLRTHGRWGDEDVLWLDDPDAQERVEEEWRWLGTVMAGADRVPRLAQPGACCVGCPWAHCCEDAAQTLESAASAEPDGLPARVAATAYAVAVARVAALRPAMRDATADESVGVPGGFVGYRSVPENTAADGAVDMLATAWHDGSAQSPDTWMGLLKSLKLGAGNLESAAKVLHPGRGPGRTDDWRERREALLGRVLDARSKARFGVWKDEQSDQPEEPP